MSASTTPIVTQLPDGTYSVEIFDGCRLSWRWDGQRCVVRVDSDRHENFQVSEPDSTISWQRLQ
jgi:hypothetical protein